MDYILALLEMGHDFFHLLAGKLGITLMSGKIVLAIVLVVLGAMIIWDLFGIIFRSGKRKESFKNMIAHGAAGAAIVECIKRVENWIFHLVVDYLGIADDSIATEVIFILVGTIVVGVVVSFFTRKVIEFTFFQPKPIPEPEPEPIVKVPEEKVPEKKKVTEEKVLDWRVLESRLRNTQEIVFQKGELTIKIFIREGHDALYFEWLSHHLTERTYKANLTGSIEGRVNLRSARLRIERDKIGEHYDKMLITVLIPAGYFQVNFDISDITNEINHSGLFSNYYTPQQVSAHFDEQCPDIARKFIEDHDMLKKTKDSAMELIEKSIKSMLKGLGFEDIPGLKKYEVEVDFTSNAWNIHRGTSQNVMGTIFDN